ncbi:glycosyltransferase, MGT family [Nannocystis exedens]|uniref:Glycosyltransferase, MGT family n=1 Tax=Nannocystis exedens TaxID=54 RepID=A0A1I2IH53_9BACT|nr:nucleotide disphospho-sugar-binding domain-containing protein [Nannocystis exedens]PCC73665.1 glycosyl transferase [Nannocystis exedens]SFF40968.1 glycosyltransferase, MGT family [Nannocystis exedens]
MTRALFVVLAEKGHVHPFVGPAQELARRGHTVAFYAPCDLREPLARAGFAPERVFVGATGAPPPDDNRGASFAALVADPERLRGWIGAMLVDTVPAEVERLTQVVRELRPDVIVADPMAYAAPIVAARAEIPWAGFSTSLNPVVPDTWDSALIATTSALPRAALFAEYGVPAPQFRVSDCLSPWLNVAWTTAALIGREVPDVLLAGASLPLDARGDEVEALALDDRPLVLMALGSQIWHQPRMFEVVTAASRGQPWQLVLAMGGLARTFAAPPDVRAVAYAPQLALLARARAFVSHGGANSVMEALAHGVPLLVSPICNDQPHNARFVAEAGAGVACDLARAEVDEVRRHLAALCGEGEHRRSARRIAASYRAAGGARAAARAVLERCRA